MTQTPVTVFAAAVLILIRPVFAPVPCTSALRIMVQVGRRRRFIGLTQYTEHGEVQERSCEIVDGGYQGVIVLGCLEGQLNQTAEGCWPKDCRVWDAVSVQLGELASTIQPLQTIFHLGSEERMCRIINPLFKGSMVASCSYGQISVDTSKCFMQWHSMERPSFRSRARHAVLGLDGGAMLAVGGLSAEGPLREVWQWTPSLSSIDGGRWEQPWERPVPPWSARYGAAAAKRWTPMGDEEVILAAGNDGRNRRDVWRWNRNPSEVPLRLFDGFPSGTQSQDCVADTSGTFIVCNASDGVIGRKWELSYDQWPSSEVIVQFKLSASGAGNATAIIAVQLGQCRLVFEAIVGEDGSQWTMYGCTGKEPPWAQLRHKKIALGSGSELQLGQTHQATVRVMRDSSELTLLVDGTPVRPDALLPAMQTESNPIPDQCWERAIKPIVTSPDDDLNADEEAQCGPVDLTAVEVVAWPQTILQVDSVFLIAAPGTWQMVVDDAPWPARVSHSLTTLPDGDLLLCGGLGSNGLLNDVWRWSPKQCTLLPDVDPGVAARYELECSFSCRPSPTIGQWKRLPDAPWRARQEHAAIWTTSGLLLVGGRTDNGFANDVWRWTYEGMFCALPWQGVWEVVTPAAAWSPRHGHGVVGFSREVSAFAADSVIIFGGYGGEPESANVQREPNRFPIQSRGDMWCGSSARGSFSNWSELAPFSPFSARSQGSATFAPTLGDFAFVIFGGYDDTSRFIPDQWKWTGEASVLDCTVDDKMTT